MAFTNSLEAVRRTAIQAEATGFLPPIFRAIGHILFTLAAIADDPPNLDDDQVIGEFTHARDHWTAATPAADSGALSDHAKAIHTSITTLLNDFITEYGGWDHATRVRNTRHVANAFAGYAVTLDLELVGLDDSDHGQNL